MILLIDNYDSFSYNLYQLLGSINPDIQVVRNDAVGVDENPRNEAGADGSFSWSRKAGAGGNLH